MNVLTNHGIDGKTLRLLFVQVRTKYFMLLISYTNSQGTGDALLRGIASVKSQGATRNGSLEDLLKFH